MKAFKIFLALVIGSLTYACTGSEHESSKIDSTVVVCDSTVCVDSTSCATDSTKADSIKFR